MQDSTVLALPGHLCEVFSGVPNVSSTVCNCRIQAVYDIRNKTFIDFLIDSYNKNDLAAAPELELQEGDLVLRDRYLTKNEVQRHIHDGADFIYRHKTNTVYLDPITEEPIDFLKRLRSQDSMDQTVLLNDKEKTPIRLVAQRVDPKTASIRRMKAKKESKAKREF